MKEKKLPTHDELKATKKKSILSQLWIEEEADIS